MNQNIYEGMTNLYSLSKTLRFELKPVGKTRENLEKNNVLGKDSKKAIAYKDIKPLLDKLHEDFIDESLSDKVLDISTYYEQRLELSSTQDKNEKRKLQEDKNGITKSEKFLRNTIGGFFIEQGNVRQTQYDLKKGGLDALSNDGMFSILKEKYNDQPELEIIKEFDKFTTYFTGYNQNRSNYYATEDKDTSIANRIVNENLPKFCSNLNSYQKYIQGKIKLENDQIFNKNYFSQCLNQFGIERYNKIVGEINSIINLHNQKTGDKIKQLLTLYKQIGCGFKKEFVASIDNNEQLLSTIKESLIIGAEKSKEIFKLLNNMHALNSESIYLSKKGLTQFSSALLKSRFTLSEALVKEKIGILDKKTHDYKAPEAVSISEIGKIINTNPNLLKDSEVGTIESTRETYLAKLKQLFDQQFKEISDVANIFDDKNEDHKEKLKTYLDVCIEVLQTLKRFAVKESKVSDIDSEFYNKLKEIIEDYQLSKLYDLLRNYLTKKPYTEEKMKLNFECSTLADGWDLNKEKDNLCTILYDGEGRYYLAITTPETRNSFDKIKNKKLYEKEGGGRWKKMEYKLLPGPNKMLPKVIFAKSNQKTKDNPLGYFEINSEILTIREKESFKKGDTFSKEDLESWIDFMQKNIAKYPDWQVFDFKFKKPREYEDVSKFYADVEKQGYRLDLVDINKNSIDELVNSGAIYLFQISNKDFNKTIQDGIRNENLHTLYRKAVFEKLYYPVKLNGEAELFYRPISIKQQDKKKPTNRDGNEISYGVVNKRYTEEKFLFHVPLTMNFSAKDEKINEKINTLVANNRDQVNIIGIDRGEKHLAYYSLINSKGEILEQGSLNTDLLGKDYAEKLDLVAKHRDEARKNRKTIGTIKELKEGYISQLVSRIVDLAIKNNAIIVLEDLNIGFKRGRQKIEKSVYQKLELALAKKLNFVVNKGQKMGPGSVSKAYQLSSPVNHFGDINKQCGIMYYTRANYTSTTDPVTGWRRHLYIKTGSKDTMVKGLSQIDSIRRNSEKGYYELVYFYKGKRRILESDIERFWTHSKDKKHRQVDRFLMTNKLDEIRSVLDKNKNILSQLFDADNNKILELTVRAIGLWMQIRNSDSENGVDCIISPVSDANGNKFDSRKELEKANGSEHETSLTKKAKMPISGDANGAYNIARKGLMILNRIFEKPEKPDLYISDEDWDKFILR